MRHAVASALAASSLPPLVMARGHRIDDIAELPLVVGDGAQSLTKTKGALELLEGLGCGAELTKVAASKKLRSGKGKMRDRKYTMRRGPLVIYAEDSGITRALRNLPGVESCHVDRMNLLQLAPGGNFGRFVIWTEEAFKRLTQLFGDADNASEEKKGYHLPRAMMTNADVARIINSDEIQSVVIPAKEKPKLYGAKKNALKNKKVMFKLNPAAKTKGALHKASKVFYNKMMKAYTDASATKKEDKADDAEE